MNSYHTINLRIFFQRWNRCAFECKTCFFSATICVNRNEIRKRRRKWTLPIATTITPITTNQTALKLHYKQFQSELNNSLCTWISEQAHISNKKEKKSERARSRKIIRNILRHTFQPLKKVWDFYFVCDCVKVHALTHARFFYIKLILAHRIVKHIHAFCVRRFIESNNKTKERSFAKPICSIRIWILTLFFHTKCLNWLSTVLYVISI